MNDPNYRSADPNRQAPNSDGDNAEQEQRASGQANSATNGDGAAAADGNVAVQYAARGWKVVPIPLGEKGPKHKGWEQRTFDPHRDFDGTNIGVQLGVKSGGLTDVDLDCIEAIKLAVHLLPKTNATFGRASKPESHWLYTTHDADPDKSVIRLNDDARKTICELRMGGGDKGSQTVFPGSTHESGERIEWAKAGAPAESSCAILKDSVTKIAVGALLARHWPQGNRHDAAMRCGGFLARAGWATDVIQDFMFAVQSTAGVTDPTHIRGGCDAAVDSALQYRAGGESYGLPKLIDMFGEPVGKRIADLLQYRAVDKDAALERMNEKYCIMPFGGKVRVLAFEQQMGRAMMTFYTAPDIKLLHDNVVMNPGESKPITLGRWWLKHSLRRQYEGMVFEPKLPRVIDGSLLNLWQGWGIVPRPGSCGLLRRHVREVLASDDEAMANYILKWTAWTFQHPDLKAETALVFRGKPGTGKGTWLWLLCKIFGQHGMHISSHHQITGRFNKHLLDCVLLFADEAFWPGDKSAEGTLKRIITEDTIMIEPKFVDATMNKNRLHIAMASNADWVAPVSIDDRRFAVTDVSAKYRNNKSYFQALYQEIENGGGAALLHELLAMDLQDWHPRYEMPKTAALRDQKELSLLAEDQWWYGLLKGGVLPRHDADDPKKNPLRARSRALMDAARQTVPGLRYASDHILGRMLGSKGCDKCRLSGQPAWQFPRLKEARAAWDERLPGTEWDDQAEWGNDNPW